MLVNEYKVWSKFLSKNVFPGTELSIGRLKHVRENDSSVIIDSCLGYGRPQTAHTAAKTTKVKDLTLIFRSVSITQWDFILILSKNILSKHLCA